jgi:hypothetical protein
LAHATEFRMIELGLIAVSGRNRQEHAQHGVTRKSVPTCHIVDDPPTFVCQLLHALPLPGRESVVELTEFACGAYHTLDTNDRSLFPSLVRVDLLPATVCAYRSNSSVQTRKRFGSLAFWHGNRKRQFQKRLR